MQEDIGKIIAENLVYKERIKKLEIENQDLKEEIVRLKAFVIEDRKRLAKKKK